MLILSGQEARSDPRLGIVWDRERCPATVMYDIWWWWWWSSYYYLFLYRHVCAVIEGCITVVEMSLVSRSTVWDDQRVLNPSKFALAASPSLDRNRKLLSSPLGQGRSRWLYKSWLNAYRPANVLRAWLRIASLIRGNSSIARHHAGPVKERLRYWSLVCRHGVHLSSFKVKQSDLSLRDQGNTSTETAKTRCLGGRQPFMPKDV